MKNIHLILISILVSLFIVFTVIQFINISFIYACLSFASALIITYILLFKTIKNFALDNRWLLSKTSIAKGQDITDVTLYLEKLKQADVKLKEHLLPVNERISKIKSLMEQSVAALNTCEKDLQAQAEKNEPAFANASGQNNKSFSQDLEQYFIKLRDDLSAIKENTNKVHSVTDNIANSAETAMQLSRNVKEGIISITTSLTESLTYSEKLFTQSRKIGEILELISDIASKTNVLSINASIVSARVGGKDGQTFGVVAREIRNLAAETEKSLSQIESVTKEIQHLIGIVTENIRISEGRTRQEMDAVLQVAGSLQGIVLGMEVVRSVSTVINEKSTSQNEAIISYEEIAQKAGFTTDFLNQNKSDFVNYLRNQATSLQKAIALLEEQTSDTQ